MLLTEICLDISGGNARFAMAECLSRIILSGGPEALSLLEEFLIFSEQLVFMKENNTDVTPSLRNAKGTITTTILVLLKQSCDHYCDKKSSSNITFAHLNRICVILLRLLGALEKITSDRDPLVQVTAMLRPI